MSQVGIKSAVETFARQFNESVPRGVSSIAPLTGASKAFAAAALAMQTGKNGEPPLVIAIAPGIPEAETLAEDLRILSESGFFNLTELPPPLEDDPGTLAARARAAAEIAALSQKSTPLVIAASAIAALASIPSIESISESSIKLSPGPSNFKSLTEKLEACGYERAVEVDSPGKYSIHGGIVDVWAAQDEKAVRIEFFGDDIESIRYFDPVLQTSTGIAQEAILPPLTTQTGTDSFLASLPEGFSALVLDCSDMEDCAFLQTKAARTVFSGPVPPAGVNTAVFETYPLPGLAGCAVEANRNPELVDSFKLRLKKFLESKSADGCAIADIDDLSLGFSSSGLCIVSERDKSLAVRRKPRPGNAQDSAGARFTDKFDLVPGELVVHADYGIGRFLGTEEMETGGQRSEVLAVEYDGGTKLFIPVAQTHLLSRYIGVKGIQVKLHKLDGKRWRRDRIDAERAVADLAARLLETQAKRAVEPGYEYNLEGIALDVFEARFPYKETEDQSKAIADVKDDMASPRPMDRLICGDAGYGKTEIAMRAAYIAAMNGRQVAVIAPTTILAQQHFENFTARFADTPLKIEILSRFQKQNAMKAAKERLASGASDIAIGTHSLFSKRLKFKDLGLLIIDEEQRFGVGHKEHLKRLRSSADILTLSATPIPRTLYLSLTGMRDMSLLRTPPRERVAVETSIIRENDDVTAAALRRELARGGQVFYIYNRTATIDRMARRISSLVPEARVDVAHAQMPAGELALKMNNFFEGRTDILICTVIVENGIDVPRANTIIVDRADRFGIADLYQLRGRVGRGSRRGYAIFTVPAGRLDAEARERLSALNKYNGAGSGYDLSMRDLEIRGAGNLLGREQSGHIASVGFGLYCRLLRRTIAALKGEAPPVSVDVSLNLDFLELSPGLSSAASGCCIPYSYVEDEPLRMNLYKRLAEVSTEAEINALGREMTDRFGKMPEQTRRLLDVSRLRILCAAHGVLRIDTLNGKAVLRRTDGTKANRVAELSRGSVDDKLGKLFKAVRNL